MEITTRGYQEEDEKDFKQSIIDLQNYECAFDPEMLSGEETVDAWFNHLLEENKQKDGQVYIAENNKKAIGFISLRIEPKGEEILLPSKKSVLITDFIVHKEYRKKGIGKMLLAKANEYAKERNISYIKLSVFVENTRAVEMYRELGFKDHDVTMFKKL